MGYWSSITSHELTEIHYLFFRISCHSIWPISHLHNIPIKRCAFLYALMTYAPIIFPTLFIRSLVEVHRSSSTTHGLFFLVFIHQILSHLGFDEFPASEPVHIIAPIGATHKEDSTPSCRVFFGCCTSSSSFFNWSHNWGVCWSDSHCWSFTFYFEWF